MTRIYPNAIHPQRDAVVVETPQGEKKLIAVDAFSDHAVWRLKDDFDGKEEMVGLIPVATSAGAQVVEAPYRFVGTTGQWDEHVLEVGADQAGGKVQFDQLLAGGLAGGADVRGPVSGSERLWFQGFGEAAPVHDVGKVDERGINWVSPLTGTRIHKYQRTPQELHGGDTVVFSRNEFGIPGNYAFDFEVYAPGITNLNTLSDEQRRELIAQMGLTVESPLVSGSGTRNLRYLGNAGIDQNNFKVGWSLADEVNHTLPPGTYPVTFKKGDQVIQQINVELR